MRVKYNGHRASRKGLRGTVVKRHGNQLQVRWDDGRSYSIHKNNLIFLSEGLAMDMKKAMQWQFSISRESQINHDKIAEDLSWENPLALVAVNRNEQLQIVIYGPLYEKARTIDAYDDYLGLTIRTDNGHIVLDLYNGADIEMVKKWAAEVRQSPWPDAYKATVKVQLLTV